MIKFYVVGDDKRTINIKNMLESEGRVTTDYKVASAIIAPTPLSKDGDIVNGTNISCDELIRLSKNKTLFAGSIPSKVKEKLKDNQITYYDLIDFEEVAILNAIPTAEGAIQTAMELTDFTLCNSNVLVMGFGRIGKVLSKMLLGIGAKVYCEARGQKDLALIKALGYNSVDLNNLDEYLPEFDVIFNTIPSLVLTSNRLDKLKKNVCIVDLASNPGGVDFEYAKQKEINAVLSLALPTKVAPMSAASYLKQTIDKLIN